MPSTPTSRSRISFANKFAGDLIGGGTLAQRRERLTATAFLLLGPTNYELQDKTVLEMDIVDEQLDTMGKAFMGLTIGCARCHDHKFDPIRHGGLLRNGGHFQKHEGWWFTAMCPRGTSVRCRWRRSRRRWRKKQAAAIGTKQKEIAALKKQLGGNTGGPVPVASLPGIVVDDLQAKLKGRLDAVDFQ